MARPLTDRRRGRNVLGALVAIALLLVTLDYREGDSGMIDGLQRGALAVFTPLQAGFATVVRPVASFFSGFADLARLREENARLQADNEALREGSISRAELQRENEQLRGLLAMEQRMAFTTTGAQVIAEPPSSFEYSVLIDAGAVDGLVPGMAVIGAEGLVGRLTQVTARHARVQLLTSPSANYVVRLAGTGTKGLLTGQGVNPFQVTLTDPEAVAEPGDEVLTQVFAGSSIPDGIPVGVLEAPRDDDDRGARVFRVRPYVDFSRLSLVSVVLTAPAPPEDLPLEEQIVEPERPRPDPPSRPADEDDEGDEDAEDEDGDGETGAEGAGDSDGEGGEDGDGEHADAGDDADADSDADADADADEDEDGG